MKHRGASPIISLAAISPSPALAHASEQGFVLLLPTDLYTGAGVVAVALTLAVLAVVPRGFGRAIFATLPIPRLRMPRVKLVTSCLSALMLLALIWAGFNGPRDPLSNPLPLMVWTVFWIGLVSVQGLLFDG